MMAETTNATLPEPDNAEAIEYTRNAQKRHPVMSAEEESDVLGSLDDGYDSTQTPRTHNEILLSDSYGTFD